MKKEDRRPLSREDLKSLRALVGIIPLRRNLAVAGCVVLASIFEGFGLATLLPLIAVLGEDPSSASGISRSILDALGRIGLSHDPRVLLAIVVAGMLLKAVMMLVALRQVGHAVADVANSLRTDLIGSLIHARWSYYVRQPIGRLNSALSSEATKAGEAYNAATQMLSQALQALVYLMVALLASWKLALVAILISGVMIASLNRLLVSAKQNARTQMRMLRGLLARLTDVLIGIKPMKAMSRQARFSLLFQRDLAVMKKASRRQVFAKHLNKVLQEPILGIFLVAGLYVALKTLQMPIGEVIMLSLLLVKIVSTVGKAQQELHNLHSHGGGFESVHGAILEARAAQEDLRAGKAPTFAQSVEFRDVVFGHAAHRTIDGVNLRIGVGDLIALTGPSGAGKTTLIDLLLGFHRPQSGDIVVDGVPLGEIDLSQWRTMIGYVPQELNLFHDTVAGNVSLGDPRFSDADIEHAIRQAGAWDFVQRLPEGVQTVVGERGGALSGGQRQRIALARALVHRPRLLILDEATSALDPESEALIVRNVADLAVSERLTVISVTHHPAWLAVASRVERLEKGRLLASIRHS
ncbi:ATP-binding cassette subfamily C protein [Panacagrimonas perspica]|uniref:ATP-binding cassette subfamily C protein n=1 Tax=Panacagrimonas perspica TaxID=381431 RepID=A0A4R7PCU6_9GAMM|nr:ATP-binding cassette subfamily C protein [Panacagrimonas perspica]